jgi:uncharacterized protein YijF (DUF1287 family)
MGVLVALALAGARFGRAPLPATGHGQPGPTEPAAGVAALIVAGARAEVEVGTVYDPRYYRLDYPGGDVLAGRGACTDVVVRALRAAGYDLQVLIHEDMLSDFGAYPQLWGASGPDPNIDHRRIPNQVTFLSRHGLALPWSQPEHWQPGDLVYWRFANGLEHCGVVSDRKGAGGWPLVIHNAGQAVEEDCLWRWEITGHYRYPPTGRARRMSVERRPEPRPPEVYRSCKDCRHFVNLIYFCEKHSRKRPDMEGCDQFRPKPLFSLWSF